MRTWKSIPAIATASVGFLILAALTPASAQESIEAVASGAWSGTILAEPLPVHDAIRSSQPILPPGSVRLTCPLYSGDSFKLSMEAVPDESSMTLAQVFDEFVEPVLQTLSFENPGQFSPGPYLDKTTGTARHGADYLKLLHGMCRQQEGIRTAEERAVCAFLNNPAPRKPAAGIDRTLVRLFGKTYAQLAEVKQLQEQSSDREYVFRQRIPARSECESLTELAVPIEHTMIFARRRPGESVTSVQGSFFSSYNVQNHIALCPLEAVRAAYANLWDLPDILNRAGDDPNVLTPADNVELVLLPSGAARTSAGPVPALYFAYRMLLFADIRSNRRTRVSWQAWVDAEDGRILQLIPQFASASVKAEGKTWGTQAQSMLATRSFSVDPAEDGYFTLSLDECEGVSDPGLTPDYTCVFSRLDRCQLCETGNAACGCQSPDSFNDGEVAVPVGDDPAFADFDAGAIGAGEVCLRVDPLNQFGQVNAFYHLHQLHSRVAAAGTISLPFPETPLVVRIDLPPMEAGGILVDDGPSALYDGKPNLIFPVGVGATLTDCISGGQGLAGKNLNAAHDPTLLAHEFGHIATLRLRERRNPCAGPGACPVPSPPSRTLFHDFADGWAAIYTGNSCIGGWYARHREGPNASFACALSSEGSNLPRALDPTVDRFPDRRHNFDVFASGYEDGQIAGAGLWTVQRSLRNNMLWFGQALQWQRLNKALFEYETTSPICSSCPDGSCTEICDKDVYRYLSSLAFEMAEEWTTDSDGLINKVLSGWAKVGIFLNPWECIDGDGTTSDCWFCSAGDTAADAIIDVEDGWNGRQTLIADTASRLSTHPEAISEMHWEQRVPAFHVWTGPAYAFKPDGSAGEDTGQCNPRYTIELSPDDQFPQGLTISSEERDASDCIATWRPALQDFVGLGPEWINAEKVYYRVTTWRDGASTRENERISTRPANGFFGTLNPPYVVTH